MQDEAGTLLEDVGGEQCGLALGEQEVAVEPGPDLHRVPLLATYLVDVILKYDLDNTKPIEQNSIRTTHNYYVRPR